MQAFWYKISNCEINAISLYTSLDVSYIYAFNREAFGKVIYLPFSEKHRNIEFLETADASESRYKIV